MIANVHISVEERPGVSGGRRQERLGGPGDRRGQQLHVTTAGTEWPANSYRGHSELHL